MAVALFGGTFNPVHNGHLRIATELAELLPVSELRMMPCGISPDIDKKAIPAQQRIKMLQIGIGDENPTLTIEDIELQRTTPSYSIDTVTLIRKNLGPSVPLFLCLGMDALASINSWNRWEQLLDFCHIAVSSRPGFWAPKKGPLFEWINQHSCADLSKLEERPAGHIYFCDLTMLAVSSTIIRDKVKCGDSIRYMAPDGVVNYIQQHRLYE
jgi:nicotinate-nucleotide adenylyltransferase